MRNHTKHTTLLAGALMTEKTHYFRVVVMFYGCECLHDLIPNIGLTCDEPLSLYISAASHWWWFITFPELKFCSIELNDIKKKNVCKRRGWSKNVYFTFTSSGVLFQTLLHVGLWKIEVAMYCCIFMIVYRLSWPKLKLTSSQCGVWTTFT